MKKKSGSKIVVHHLNKSRSQRILWLLEELELDYEIRAYRRNPKTLLAPRELRAIHPLGKSPTLTDGDLVIAESGAIVEYLIDRYGEGRFKPKPGTPDYLRYIYWLHYAEGSAMLPFLLTLIFKEVTKAPVPFFVKPVVQMVSFQVHKAFIDPQLKLHLNFIESEIGNSPWLAGSDLTGADIMISFVLIEGIEMGLINFSRPKILEYCKKIQARPAYQRALEKGLSD